ncbi:MAG TPA: type I restriction enzyme HsdR N-terminal domain-containing protein [Verrucomicrobiae bacterium]|nr:type I restriction enzyme HsdR N-terminal domain-containing protein [Verrucomicrobiae bacterium]
MKSIPNKVASRLAAGIKKFQPILADAKNRDCNEADTVDIVKDILSETFGYDKFREITSEHAIKGTYCDLAIKLNDNTKPCLLIEGKAVDVELKENQINQAVFYGVKEGVKWIILTNGLRWQVYKIIFGQPINQELVLEFEFLKLNHKVSSDLQSLYLITKEGNLRCCLEDYDAHQQALNRFSLAATILTKPVREIIRRELRRVSPNAKITIEEIESALRKDVLKGEVVDDHAPKVLEAQKKLAKAQNKAAKKTARADDSSTPILASGSPFAENSAPVPEQPPV